MNNWHTIWLKKGTEQIKGKDSLENMLALNGYDTQTSKVTIDSWQAYVKKIITKIAIKKEESIFEVGCGAGAFLYALHQMGYEVGGLDYSSSLVSVAKMNLQNIICDEAYNLDTIQYDHVISGSVFNYFPDESYVTNVLHKMVLKAKKSICILDLNDILLKEKFIQFKRSAYSPGEYEIKYHGLDQLYFNREWFKLFADEHEMHCEIENQMLPGYLNSEYRFNVYLKK